MSISSPFIKRPVATSLIAVAFLVIGVVCYFQLPVAALPDVDVPTLQVSASLPGGSPETMASNVATPLERQFSQIPGISEMTSTNVYGSTSITLQFELSRNIDAAAQDVQSAINAAGGQLPNNLPNPPIVRKVNPTTQPVFGIDMMSETLPLATVSDYADSIVGQQLARLDGVGQVLIGGVRKPAIRIRIDPRKAAAMGLQLDAIRAAITANTVNAPKGQFTGPRQAMTIYANDQVQDPKMWDQLIVGYAHGAPVRVRDLGGAVMDVENTQSGGYAMPGPAKDKIDPTMHSGPSIIVLTQRAPGANVIHMVDGEKKILPDIAAAMPPTVEMHVIEDKTQTIRASVADVEITLLITVVLVVIVIFLFLRNVRATLIPSAVIPLALLGSAAIMLPAHFSVDNLSLMALTIAVGFVVDDAIVMTEAIWRRIEHGEPPFQAALNGAAEIGFTILSISISLVAVFTPLMFMGGIVGRLMREFALTLSAAVLLSVILALTFIPMLCGKFLKPPEPPRNRFIKALETGFHRLEQSYARGLDLVMRHMFPTLLVFIGTALLAGMLYVTSRTGFFPQQDTGFLQGAVITAQDSSFSNSYAKCMQVLKILASDPDVGEAHFNTQSNASQTNLNIELAPRDQRKASADEIIARLRPKLAQVVGAQTILQASQDVATGGRASRAEYQYTLADGDISELNEWAPKLLAAVVRLPELKDVTSDQQSTARSVNVVIDRDAAGRFGISPADIDTAIYNQVGQRQAAQYFTQLNAYHVVIEAPPDLQVGPELFSQVFIKSPITGKGVPLSLLVRFSTQARSLSISHQAQYPAATISFNLAPGVSLGQATKAIEQAREDLGAPPSLQGAFQGTAAAFQESLSSMPILIAAALASVYIILGVLYESYVHPLTILSTLPSAGVGALLALRLVGQDLNVIGIIAIILLIGIVKKNGIMIVDVALKHERERGISAKEAVIEASHQRFRPILMTTACAFLGGVPMIFGGGSGSEFRQPLGWAIVGGLVVSQALTLFTTPVIYVYLDRFRRREPAKGAVPQRA